MDQYDFAIIGALLGIGYVLSQSFGGVSDAYEGDDVSDTIEEDQEAGTVPSGTDNPFNDDYEDDSNPDVGSGDYGYDTDTGQHESVGRGSQDGWGL